jgi:hypothetical protein
VKRTRSKTYGTVLALAGLGGAALFWLTLSVQAQQAVALAQVPDNVAPHPAPEQPVPYSHKTHLALGVACEACHSNPAIDAEMGLPSAATCMGCHNAIATETAAVRELSRLAAASEPVAWARVYQVLPGVTWSHAPHRAAGLACSSCHGDVAALDAMAMTTSVTAMASCISCHEAHEASTECATCHAWPSE